MKRLLFAVTLALCAAADAQPYPTNTIHIVAPFAPGGNVNIYARAVAPGLTDKRDGKWILVNHNSSRLP